MLIQELVRKLRLLSTKEREVNPGVSLSFYIGERFTFETAEAAEAVVVSEHLQSVVESNNYTLRKPSPLAECREMEAQVVCRRRGQSVGQRIRERDIK